MTSQEYTSTTDTSFTARLSLTSILLFPLCPVHQTCSNAIRFLTGP